MKPIRKTIRFIAAFLIVNMLYYTFYPSIAFALTAGPTAPEATSFEPVDTTDMVNLATGDLVYNIPLLEVPGPSGGYPISLSYHAGIQPDEEASWVGLGWTLNPGSIARTVNGYPDDHHAAERKVTDTWEGGERSTFSVGLGLPGASFGISISQDTYEGFGVGQSASSGTSFGLGKGGSGVGLGINFSVGNDGYGNSSAGIGAGLNFGKTGEDAQGLTGNIGLSSNFNSVSLNGGLGMGYGGGSHHQSLLGVSLSSTGGGFSSSIGGFSANQVNSNAGRIQTSGSGFFVPIPLGTSGMFLNLGYNYVRYWSHEESIVNTYGALYPSWHDPDSNSYDSFALLDPDADGGIVENDEADKVLGGSMVAADHYSVNAQGLSGTIKPYSYFRGSLYRQNLKKQGSSDDIIKYVNKSTPHPSMSYRFENDFSSKYYFNDPKITQNISTGLSFSGDAAQYDSESFDYSEQRVGGSRHIEWITNEDIFSGTAYTDYGLVLPIDKALWPTSKYGYDINKQVGAYLVKNEKGMTYHYARPAYAYDEYIHTSTIDDSQGEVTNDREHLQPYAYTWYLTAITGPDFVDRGVVGQLDEEDYGYWVKFDYGMWTDQYIWRNPSNGTHKDLDANFENFSTGKKEIWYLDQISTESHTALFLKDIRNDGKSIAIPGDFFLNKNGVYSFSEEDRGFQDKEVDVTFRYGYKQNLNVPGPSTYELDPSPSPTSHFITHACTKVFSDVMKPISLLRLDKIYLVENSKLNEFIEDNSIADLKQNGTQKSHSINPQFVSAQESGDSNSTIDVCTFDGDTENHWMADLDEFDFFPNGQFHFGEEVFDVNDISGVGTELKDISNRQIVLKTDYSLCPETANSFSNENLYQDYQSPPASGRELTGKLTLNALNFNGKGGVDGMIPPINFGYDLQKPLAGTTTLDNSNSEWHFTMVQSTLTEGDIIKFNSGGKVCYALIRELTGSNYKLKIIGDSSPVLGTINWVQTKNPPYNSETSDMWGLFKPDYEHTDARNIDKRTSPLSSKSVDCWSLAQVQTSLGSQIEIAYDSDQYNKSVLNSGFDFIIDSFEELGGDQVKINITNNGYDLRDVYKLTDPIDYLISVEQRFIQNGVGGIDGSIVYDLASPRDLGNEVFLDEIGEDYLIVDNALFHDQLYHFENVSCPDQCFIEYGPIGGNFSVDVEDNYGGGVRVVSITVHDLLKDRSTKTNYDYNCIENSKVKTSGVTSFTPIGLYKFTDYGLDDDHEALKVLKTGLFDSFSRLLVNSRLIPAPGVIYGNVTVTESIQHGEEEPIVSPEKVTYEFQTFEKEMMVREETNMVGTETWPARTLALRDKSAHLGALTSVTHYDKEGEILTKTENKYLNNDPEFETKLANDYHNQGLISELFLESREVETESQLFRQSMLLWHEEYPLIQTEKVTKNYKTGITTTIQNLAFDFYSGAVTKTLSTDGYGNTYMSETLPAYRQYGGEGGMGLAMNGGKNMLTQAAAKYTYKVSDPVNRTKEALLSANIQTWNDHWSYRESNGTWDNTVASLDQHPVWRKHKAYTYQANGNNVALTGEGLFAYSSISDFNEDGHPAFYSWDEEDSRDDELWQKNSEITLYDRYSHALEATDINGNYAATKMNINHEHVYASVANASYNEFAYCGAEDTPDTNGYLGGEVLVVPSYRKEYPEEGGSNVHTGHCSIQTESSQNAFQYTLEAIAGRKYLVSTWSNKNDIVIDYNFSGGPSGICSVAQGNAKLKQVGDDGWYQITALIESPSSTSLRIQIKGNSGTTNHDDFRVHPVNAPMTSYVYNQWGELSYVLDNNNLYTHYKYDAMGRLKSTHRETFQFGKVKLSEHEINYAMKGIK